MSRDYKAMEHLGIMLADKVQSGDVMDRQSVLVGVWHAGEDCAAGPGANGRPTAAGDDGDAAQVGRYQDAKDHLERFLLPDSPKDPDLLEQLADCQAGLREFDKAQKSFKKAIENAIASKCTQATAYVEAGRTAAIPTLERPKKPTSGWRNW